MEQMLTFARGPLFTATFLFMILGLIRQIYLAVDQYMTAYKKISHNDFSHRKGLKSIFEWLLPYGHLYRIKPLLSIISFLFHVGLLSVPIFLPHHIVLFSRGLGISWPGIPLLAADILTIITIITVTFLIVYRILDYGTRTMSTGIDYFLLILIGTVFVSGFMATHPVFHIASYSSLMLVHILSAELLFVLIPYTKLVHCVLFPFDRLSTEIFWKFPVGAGDKIARELHGEEVRV